MKLLRRAILGVAAVSVFGLLGACGGGSERADSTPTVDLSATAQAFLDLLEQGIGVTYRVTYQTTTPEGDPGDTFVVVNKPPRTRIDTVPSGPSEPRTAIVGGAADQPASGCAMEEGAWQCVEIDSFSGSVLKAAGPIAFLGAGDLGTFDAQETEGRTVGGQPTRCFTLTPSGGGETSEYCLTESGVPLYADTPFRTSEATDFSADVSDVELEPPAAPSPS